MLGPTSGPENINVQPLPTGSGRSRARTTHDDDDAENDENVDDGDLAASVKDANRITLLINWNVRNFFSRSATIYGEIKIYTNSSPLLFIICPIAIA